MDKVEKIGTVEAICLIITVFANQIIFNTPNIILLDTGPSAWINIIYISIIAIIFICIVCKIFKKFPQYDIVDISNFLGGKFLKILIGILYMTFFIIFNVLPLCYFANTLKLIYFHKTPFILLVALFLIPPVVINRYGLKSVAGLISIFTPVVLIGIFSLFFGASQNFAFYNIFPIFGFGVKETFLYRLTNLFAFSGIAYLFFLNPILKKPDNLKKISITVVIIASIYLFLAITILLLSFSSIIVNDQILSLYLLTRVIQFGTFFQRVDAIFIFIWIISTFCLLSLGFYYIINIFKKLTKIENSKMIIYPLATIFFSGSLILTNIADLKQYTRILYKNFAVSLIFIISFIILILANYKLKKQQKKRKV